MILPSKSSATCDDKTYTSEVAIVITAVLTVLEWNEGGGCVVMDSRKRHLRMNDAMQSKK